MRSVRLLAATLFGILLLPAAGRADVLFTPFIGGNLGGSVTSRFADFVGDQSRTTFGGSIAAMSGGIFGIEGDLGFTPKFFGTDVQLQGVPVSVARNNVLTAMANLTVGVPLQSHGGPGIRPYGVGGVGLIRQQFDLIGGLVDYTANDLGYNIGGGVLIFPSAHVGIRGDVRYFRSIGANTVSDLLDLQPGAFNFTRATVGVTFRY
jgi:Outer membrane protein beta-barrel domain